MCRLCFNRGEVGDARLLSSPSVGQLRCRLPQQISRRARTHPAQKTHGQMVNADSARPQSRPPPPYTATCCTLPPLLHSASTGRADRSGEASYSDQPVSMFFRACSLCFHCSLNQPSIVGHCLHTQKTTYGHSRPRHLCYTGAGARQFDN